MTMLSVFTLAIGFIAAIASLVTWVAQVASYFKLHQPVRLAQTHPPISVLKPLKGCDDGLYENLLSMARQQYANYEVIFGAEDANDPALDVARRVQAECADVDIRVIHCPGQLGLNPKVHNLIHLARSARHDLLMISDSNVRVDPHYLAACAAELEAPGVGMVANVLVGVGEASLGARLENLHMNSWICTAVCAPDMLAGHAIVVGKSMLFRRADLERAGGFHGVRNVLAEDYLLGRKFAQQGLRVVISNHRVTTINRTWSLGRFMSRHLRWHQLRRHVSLRAYAAEPLLNPLPLWLACLVCAWWAPRDQRVLAVATAAALTATFVKLLADACLTTRLRERGPSIIDLCLVPLKDLLIFGIWLVAFTHDRVVWRGNAFRISAGSTLRALEHSDLDVPNPSEALEKAAS